MVSRGKPGSVKNPHTAAPPESLHGDTFAHNRAAWPEHTRTVLANIMGSRFYFGDDSGSDIDNDSSLPFPKPLARSAFLDPDFDPNRFLANLSDRYQTLEDLRKELRDLSQSLSRELLDLVNDNYQEFLSLGSTLRGGEEKIEEVRVGLLGFQRDLTSIGDDAERRRNDVAELIAEKRNLAKHIQAGKSLLGIAKQIEDLEAGLMIGATANINGMNDTPDISDESDDDVDGGEMPMRRLERHVEQYLVLRLLLGRHDPKQPYVLSESARLAQIRSTLSLDLQGALEHSKSMQRDQPDADSRMSRLTELLSSVNGEEQLSRAV